MGFNSRRNVALMQSTIFDDACVIYTHLTLVSNSKFEAMRVWGGGGGGGGAFCLVILLLEYFDKKKKGVCRRKKKHRI